MEEANADKLYGNIASVDEEDSEWALLVDLSTKVNIRSTLFACLARFLDSHDSRIGVRRAPGCGLAQLVSAASPTCRGGWAEFT